MFIYRKAVFPFLTTTTLCVTRSFIPLIGQCPVKLTFEPQGTAHFKKASPKASSHFEREIEIWRTGEGISCVHL